MIVRAMLAAALAFSATPALAQYGGTAGFIAEFDLDKDGVVPKTEFVAARNKRFDATDANRDGVVDKAEYLGEFSGRLDAQLAASKRTAAQKASERDAQMEQAPLRFDILDKNNNGLLERSEFQSSGEGVFYDHDLNHDGKVAPGEKEVPGAVTGA